MTVFHFFNCAILTFGPHAVYYSATPLCTPPTLFFSFGSLTLSQFTPNSLRLLPQIKTLTRSCDLIVQIGVRCAWYFRQGSCGLSRNSVGEAGLSRRLGDWRRFSRRLL